MWSKWSACWPVQGSNTEGWCHERMKSVGGNTMDCDCPCWFSGAGPARQYDQQDLHRIFTISGMQKSSSCSSSNTWHTSWHAMRWVMCVTQVLQGNMKLRVTGSFIRVRKCSCFNNHIYSSVNRCSSTNTSWSWCIPVNKGSIKMFLTICAAPLPQIHI